MCADRTASALQSNDYGQRETPRRTKKLRGFQLGSSARCCQQGPGEAHLEALTEVVRIERERFQCIPSDGWNTYRSMYDSHNTNAVRVSEARTAQVRNSSARRL